MDYVLFLYGAVLFVAGYAFIWTLGGPTAKLVLTLGAYAYSPNYPRRPARGLSRLRRGHPDHRARTPGFNALQLAAPFPASCAHGYEHGDHHWYSCTGTSPFSDVPTVVVPALVRAEQAPDEYGAEHWGTLLAQMTTEERTIYSAQMVETYEATKAVERPALSALDEAVARFNAANAAGERRDAAALAGIGVNLLRRHGGEERWQTGQYPALVPTT